MQINYQDNGKSGRFFIKNDTETLAEMLYTHHGAQLISIDHTEVSETLQGKGIARQLVDAGVAYARENQLKISPICPYAAKVMTGNPEYADVLR